MKDSQATARTEARGRRGAMGKPLVLITVLTLGLLVIYATPLRGYLRHITEVRAAIEGAGALGILVYMLSVFVLVALGAPRLIFCPVGGLAFGFAWGLVWTQIPTLLGYYVLFLFVRWGGREFVASHWPRLARLGGLFERRGYLGVFLGRQLPISGIVINLLLGLSPVSHLDFLVGSAVGILPAAIPCTLIGSSAAQLDKASSHLHIAIAVAAMVGLWLVAFLFGRFSSGVAKLRGEMEQA